MKIEINRFGRIICAFLASSSISAGAQPNSYLFSLLPNTKKIILLDGSGHEIKSGGDASNQAASILFDGRILGSTSYRKRQLLIQKLAPIAINGSWLKLPLREKTVMVNGWAASELDEDRILISGGTIDNAVSNATWIFSAKAKKASESNPLAVARVAHCSTLLSNNCVLVTGGFADERQQVPLKSYELFDVIKGAFCKAGNLCLPRGKHTVVGLDSGLALAIGGITEKRFADDSTSLTASLELIDPSKRVSVLAGKLIKPRNDVQAVAVGQRKQVLIFGGSYMDGLESYRNPSSELFSYY